MKPRVLLNIVLLVLVLALGALLYYKQPKKEREHYKLTALTAEQVTDIRIVNSAAPNIVIQKQNNKWLITKPFAARTNPTNIGRVLDLLGAYSEKRFNAKELARFDLDRPQAQVYLNQQRFDFGTLNPLTREQYVATNNTVYLVPTYFTAAAFMRMEELISHRLLSDEEIPIEIKLRNFKITQQDGKWVSNAELNNFSQDDLNKWIGEWRLATSIATESYGGKPTREDISIRINGGKTIYFAILQTEPEFVLVRLDENIQYRFPLSTGKRLLRMP